MTIIIPLYVLLIIPYVSVLLLFLAIVTVDCYHGDYDAGVVFLIVVCIIFTIVFCVGIFQLLKIVGVA